MLAKSDWEGRRLTGERASCDIDDLLAALIPSPCTHKEEAPPDYKSLHGTKMKHHSAFPAFALSVRLLVYVAGVHLFTSRPVARGVG